MYISPIELEWASPEAKQPRVFERFFIQYRHCATETWRDAFLDFNSNGLTTHDQALRCLERLEKDGEAELRIARRTFTIEADVPDTGA